MQSASVRTGNARGRAVRALTRVHGGPRVCGGPGLTSAAQGGRRPWILPPPPDCPLLTPGKQDYKGHNTKSGIEHESRSRVPPVPQPGGVRGVWWGAAAPQPGGVWGAAAPQPGGVLNPEGSSTRVGGRQPPNPEGSGVFGFGERQPFFARDTPKVLEVRSSPRSRSSHPRP